MVASLWDGIPVDFSRLILKKKEQTHSYLNIITSINKNGGVSLFFFLLFG